MTFRKSFMMNFKLALLIALGGALGTLARYGVSVFAAPYSQSLPWGTIVINVTGSFVIGCFGTLTLANGRFPVPEAVRLFVMVGLCGGYTTFSAFSLQTLDLLRAGFGAKALFNVVFSVIACILAVSAGYWVASQLNPGADRVAQARAEELG
jgi:CrcB protein